MFRHALAAGCVSLLLLLVAGCGGSATDTDTSANSTPVEKKEVVFKDSVESNVKIPDGLDGLVFIDTNGERIALKSYIGKKNIVLVFTEGFAGMLCPCLLYTSPSPRDS